MTESAFYRMQRKHGAISTWKRSEKAEKEKLLRTRYAFSSTQSVMCTLAHPGLPLMQRRSPGKRHGTCGP